MNFIEIGDYIFPTLLACTEKEQAQGLMWIKKDPPVMTFIYKNSDINKMWMRNTYVPLDMVFCHDGKIVSIAQGLPLSDEMLGPDVPTDMVVELPGGTCDQLGITVGQSIALKLDVLGLAHKISSNYSSL